MLCILDINSLHTNIPHQEGIESIQEIMAIHRAPIEMPHNTCKVELLRVVLEENYFDYSGRYNYQIAGTAMDTKLAPSYANLFMSNFEDKCVCAYPQHPLLWERFIDEIFLIWTYSMQDFMDYLNNCHPAI